MDKLEVRNFFTDNDQPNKYTDNQILDLLINMINSEDQRVSNLGGIMYHAFLGKPLY